MRGPRQVIVFTALLVVALGDAACEAAFPSSSRHTVSLHMKGTPAEASVSVDEEFVGPIAVVAARGVALPEGTHQVTVEAPGYFPWDKLVVADVSKAKTVELAVDLRPIPR